MLSGLAQKIKAFQVEEDGPTLVEYAVMLMLVVLLCVTGVQLIAGFCQNSFGQAEQIFSKDQ